MRYWIALALLIAVLRTGDASGITTNPIDSELPLDVHAVAFCLGNDDETTDENRAQCNGALSDENPETLTFVLGLSDAEGDLRSGTLRARGQASAYWFGEDQLRAGSLGSTTVYDTITVGGGYTGPLEVRLVANGSFATTDANPNVMGSEAGGLLLGLDDVGVLVGSTGVLIDQYNAGGVYLGSENETGSASLTTNADPNGDFDPADVRFELSVVFDVTQSERSFTFLARLSAGAALGFTEPADSIKQAVVDFGDTAQLSVVLPEHVPWTSASGVLLAPEPSAPLSAAALVGALAALRRRARVLGTGESA